MSGTRGAKRRQRAARDGLAFEDIAADLATARYDPDELLVTIPEAKVITPLERARVRLVSKRLADSARHTHRVQNTRVARLAFRPLGGRRRAGSGAGRIYGPGRKPYVKADTR